MVLLSKLKRRIKFWWKPTWEIGYSYVVEESPSITEPVFRITMGKYSGVSFTLKDIKLENNDDGSKEDIVSFEADFIIGRAPEEIIVAIFQDTLVQAIENSKQLHREVLNDRTEDCGMDYFEESVDERRVCSPSSSISKE